MASILICISPAESHVGPSLEVARAFVERGWRVRVLTGGRFADRTRARWAPTRSRCGEADNLDSADTSDRPRGVQAMNDGLYRNFFAPADAQLRAILDATEAEPVGRRLRRPDLLRHVAPEHVARAPGDRRRQLLPGDGLQSRHRALRPRDHADGRAARHALRNRFLTWTARRVVLRRGARARRPVLRRPRSARSGRAASSSTTSTSSRASPTSSASCRCPRSSTRAATSPTGSGSSGPRSPAPASTCGSRTGGRTSTAPGPSCTSPRGRSPTPTSESSSGPRSRLWGRGRPRGGRDRASRRPTGRRAPPLPANARVAGLLPYDQLMPRLSAFVTNGGYGGLNAALAHGVPVVVAGDTEDKVGDVGAGRLVRAWGSTCGRAAPARARSARPCSTC